MTLPADFQEHIDWVNQPPPTNARDTHALHFFLTTPDYTAYQGLMFYRPGSPTAPNTQRQPGIQGKGYLIPNFPVCQQVVGSPFTPPLPAPWVRVQVTYRTTADGTSRMFANLIFQEGDEIGGLPGSTTSDVEAFDKVITVYGAVLMFVGPPPGWLLNLTQTTVSL